MKALFLTVLLLFSCSKSARLDKEAIGMRLSEVRMNIHHLNEIDWLIGKKKEATVSQSFTFEVEMPKVDEEDLDYLTELKGINAWILRLIVQRGSETQDLGSLYARFRPKKILRGQGGGAPTQVSVKVYYAAGFPSERFRGFHCPAFGHNKRIKKMKINGEEKSFDLTFDQIISYPEKSQLVELTPSAFNGGNSLVGEYFIEIAPYDSEKKVIHGPFSRIPMWIEVTEEESQIIKSCLGEHPEINK